MNTNLPKNSCLCICRKTGEESSHAGGCSINQKAYCVTIDEAVYNPLNTILLSDIPEKVLVTKKDGIIFISGRSYSEAGSGTAGEADVISEFFKAVDSTEVTQDQLIAKQLEDDERWGVDRE